MKKKIAYTVNENIFLNSIFGILAYILKSFSIKPRREYKREQ